MMSNLTSSIPKRTHTILLVVIIRGSLCNSTLITENKELPTFSSRRVSVYGRLSAEQAQHLAHGHNRTTPKMNTQGILAIPLNFSMHAHTESM